MNITANGKIIVAATKDLGRRWMETKEHWQDAKAHDFEQKYLNELFTGVDRAMTIFEDLDKVIGKVRSDCE
jgi:hypothetical protein